jgi:type IV pilus assembly protein PilX
LKGVNIMNLQVTSTTTLRKNRGSILFISLILLLVITVIGISSISTTGLNEKMASNYSDHNLAFQAAEAALLAGEQHARDVSAILDGAGLSGAPGYFSCTTTNCFTATCLNGLCFNGSYPPTGGGASAGICVKTNPATPLWETTATWTTSGRYAEHPVSIPGLAAKPKYIVEFMCYVQADPTNQYPTTAPNYGTDWSYMYRVTALGVGRTSASKAMVQSTLKVPR